MTCAFLCFLRPTTRPVAPPVCTGLLASRPGSGAEQVSLGPACAGEREGGVALGGAGAPLWVGASARPPPPGSGVDEYCLPRSCWEGVMEPGESLVVTKWGMETPAARGPQLQPVLHGVCTPLSLQRSP